MTSSSFALSATQKRTAAWVGIALTLMLVVWLLGPVLMPFVVAAVLAYALHPAVEAMVAKRVPRVVAVVVVEVLALMAIAAVLLLLVPIIAKQVPLLREQIPVLVAKVIALVSPVLQQVGIEPQFDAASVKEFLRKHLGDNVEDVLGTAVSSARIGGSVVLAIIGNVVLIPAALFFVLMDWPHLVSKARALIPLRYRESVESFMTECDELLGQYMRGQLLVMLALSVYFSVTLALFGFNLALPVGVFTGLAIAVPYLGFGLGAVLALLAGLLQFPGTWYGVAVVVGVYGVGQLLESLVLTPRLVGERIGLTPLSVIFALLAFGQLFGFIGVLIALPASAVAAVALRRLRGAYVASDLYSGVEPGTASLPSAEKVADLATPVPSTSEPTASLPNKDS
jgi:predicted PurR-regulated permease PerM